MNDEITEMIKDLSEAALAIVTAICLIIKTKRDGKHSKRSKKK